MSKHTIRFGLSERDIDRAIKEVEAYKRELLKKVEVLRERIAQRVAVEARSGFNGAVVDDLVNDAVRTASVDVTIERGGEIVYVIANGEDAIWVEFGSGVYHNGAAGSSPHPQGAELGFTIGGYGKGMGNRQTWGFYEDGELRLTHGAPAVMPMYNAMKNVIADIPKIAREVFNS